MRNRKYSTVIIDGVDYWEHFKFPFVVQKALDDSLDFAVIELHGMRRKDPFKPFSPITIGEGNTALSYVVAYDEVEELYGQNRYKHTVTIMEKTKETERIMCGAKAFTNPLVRDYTDGRTLLYGLKAEIKTLGGTDYDVTSYDFENPIKSSYTASPMAVGSIPLYADFGIKTMEDGRDTFQVDIYYSENGEVVSWSKGTGKNSFTVVGEKIFSETFSKTSGNELGTFNANNPGIYGILYIGSYRAIYSELMVTKTPVSKDHYTIENVVNQILDTSETIRVGLNAPRYRLRYKSEQQRVKFRQNAPEFRFSNGRSLWENLREVGQYVHAIPRAVHDLTDGLDYIEFDDLGGTEHADLSKGDRYGGSANISIGDYTAGLESMAVNLINVDDESEGSMTEPFGGGWVSLRASTEEARIAEGTGIIKTAYPIAKLLKVEVGSFTVGDKTYEGGDITPYVFSKSEYDILSSFSGAYPTSKTYALYYTPDSPNVSGLWYKAQDGGSEIFNAFEDYSVTNVITASTGAPSGALTGLDYSNLIFRVTYIPSVTARVRQYNPIYEGAFPAILAHNQSANKLSAKAFGENLRGQLAMMSKADEVVMYRFPRVEDMPEPGTLYDDDRYISGITARVYHDFVLAQISLSAGYNQLGSRVEINNAIRQFEIPSAEDRYTILEEFCEIGVKTSDDPFLAMTDNLKSEVLKAFSNQSRGMDIDLAELTTKDENGEVITNPSVVLPVVSLSLGTSLYFGWRFESNFSAGSKSTVGGERYRIQDHVPYGDDFYSHAHTVGFKLLTGATSKPPVINSAHMLPEATGAMGWTVMVDTGNYPILWHKDSADAGCLSYQLHYITNDGLIIGDGVAYHCAAVRSHVTPQPTMIYFFPHRINQLTGTTDTSNCIATCPITVDMENGCLTYIGAPEGFMSWAIIKGGKFMLGKNTTEAPQKIYFNFKRRSVK